MTWAFESLKKFHFNRLLLSKVYTVWNKKAERSYLSWQWGVMQNLKKNWLVAWKMTWVIWQIFTKALESLKNFHFNGLLLSKAKYILFELKKCRGVIFHKTVEGYKIWRGIDLLLQNWPKEFDKFWPEHSLKSQKFWF